VVNGQTIFSKDVTGTIKFPIPGLSVDIPDVGLGVGVMGDVAIGEESDNISIQLQLAACVNLIVFSECYPNPPLTVFELDIGINNFCTNDSLNQIGPN
jgi:hypothetical protein